MLNLILQLRNGSEVDSIVLKFNYYVLSIANRLSEDQHASIIQDKTRFIAVYGIKTFSLC